MSATTSAIDVFTWLFTLVACIAGTVATAAALRWGNPRSRWVLVPAAYLGLVWVLFALMTPQTVLTDRPVANSLIRQFAVGGAVFAAAILMGMLQKLRYQPSRRGQLWGWRAFVAAQFATSLAACAMFCHVLAPPVAEEIMDDSWAKMTEVPEVVITTDLGRRVPAFRIAGTPPTNLKSIDSISWNLQSALIRQAGPDLNSNCFGWVFTDGNHLLRSETIESILQDNKYVPVDDPQVGDIIIYRDLLSRIIHVGLVRVVSAEDLVLVESKWGIGGRFIHRPEDQAFSDTFSYYRTDRGSHLIAGVSARAAARKPAAATKLRVRPASVTRAGKRFART